MSAIIHEGMAILVKYRPDGECAYEHDIIYAHGPQEGEASDNELNALADLGWWPDPEIDDLTWSRF